MKMGIIDCGGVTVVTVEILSKGGDVERSEKSTV